MRLTGVFMTLCALVACSQGRQAPFPAVIGEPIALTPLVSGTLGHYTVNPPLPPGLPVDGRNGVISGPPNQTREPPPFDGRDSGHEEGHRFSLVRAPTR